MLVVSFRVSSHRCEVFMVSCSSYSEFVYRWRWYSLQPRLFTAYVYVALLDLLRIFTNLLKVLSIRQFEHRTRRPQTFNGGATDSVALQPTCMSNASRFGSQVASSVTASL